MILLSGTSQLQCCLSVCSSNSSSLSSLPLDRPHWEGLPARGLGSQEGGWPKMFRTELSRLCVPVLSVKENPGESMCPLNSTPADWEFPVLRFKVSETNCYCHLYGFSGIHWDLRGSAASCEISVWKCLPDASSNQTLLAGPCLHLTPALLFQTSAQTAILQWQIFGFSVWSRRWRNSSRKIYCGRRVIANVEKADTVKNSWACNGV